MSGFYLHLESGMQCGLTLVAFKQTRNFQLTISYTMLDLLEW